MTAPSLRIGILGAGPIAQAAHLEAVRKARNTTLHALCDQADDLRTRVSAIHQPAHQFARYDDMLADPALDAVIIATADAFHVPAALQALAAGKHVLVEKPLGITVEECTSLQAAVTASGRVLQVGHMKRFDPGIAFAHDFIRDELGDVVSLKAWYADSAYRYTMTDALQPIIETGTNTRRPHVDPKADRPRYLLLTHGAHLVDTARFLAGDITHVHARRTIRDGIHCWFVATTFASGTLGHLDLTVAVQGDWHEGFQVFGTLGSVIGRTFLPWYRRASEVEAFSARDRLHRRPLGEDGDAYRRQVEAFADTILTGAPQTGATVADGLATTQVLAAIARSAASGEPVAIADVTGPV